MKPGAQLPVCLLLLRFEAIERIQRLSRRHLIRVERIESLAQDVLLRGRFGLLDPNGRGEEGKIVDKRSLRMLPVRFFQLAQDRLCSLDYGGGQACKTRDLLAV